jgi:hypothetical protein
MTLSFLSSHYIQRARFGSLSPYVKTYITLVLNNGYKPTTIIGQLRLIARLNRWLLRMDYDLDGLGVATYDPCDLIIEDVAHTAKDVLTLGRWCC